MAIAILRNDDRTDSWIRALEAVAPEIPLYDYHQPHPREAIRMVGVWKHPPGSLGEYPNLLGVHGLGAGVDFILEDPDLPEGLPVLRVVDPYLASDMAEYVLAQILSGLRQLPAYTLDQYSNRWNPRPYNRIEDVRVGIMGLGTLGKAVADLLVRTGFDVRGWTARSQPATGYPVFQGPEGRQAFLSESDILVCLLPLTPKTRGILDQSVFDQLPVGARLINVARGPLLNEEDLLEAFRTGQVAQACLDVFSQEPLPNSHPFWNHPGISMTPHVASVSEPESVAAQVIANYRALLGGGPLANVVSRERGY
ncbi:MULTISPECIES: 2-hydroxyacid dehydrogenase [unclassified Robiginitalea]|uniref:2-hydroxyacid dehydrogenase n=1 Tax=Robiginitalea TaxID=252306 RepID=UPI00234B489F|nr:MULTISPECIES: glyoxylate/hydroxypyruvate reductase A [unclassified Robiginitalea]MDC6354076.1 glyoxylate/hydroxypyruvate reductase A [Robiginitalea sp. PM2]MDC6374343.1 glyoxylate/hydroxypyruvate reductase A [Robiginitalea sp. SP8]